MLHADIKHSKLSRIIKNNDAEMKAVTEVLLYHYRDIKNIFMLQAAHSTYPAISWNDFTNFCHTVISL